MSEKTTRDDGPYENVFLSLGNAKDQTDAASRAFNELVMGSKFDLEAMT